MPKKKLMELQADGRVWITIKEGKFIGKGRIELMEKIKEFGSIRQAAASMKMSYRQAWQLIDDANTKAQTSLIISHCGGKGGGGATVTKKGEEIIALYKSFQKRFQQFLIKESAKFKF